MFMERPAGCSWNGWPDAVECAMGVLSIQKVPAPPSFISRYRVAPTTCASFTGVCDAHSCAYSPNALPPRYLHSCLPKLTL